MPVGTERLHENSRLADSTRPRRIPYFSTACIEYTGASRRIAAGDESRKKGSAVVLVTADGRNIDARRDLPVRSPERVGSGKNRQHQEQDQEGLRSL